jgi:hypothetical protein
MNYPKTTNHMCVGCQGIRERGGGRWLPGEPHYVGCPTELAELRSENRVLRGQINQADGTWAGLRARLFLGDFRSVNDVLEYCLSKKAYAPPEGTSERKSFIGQLRELLDALERGEMNRSRNGNRG